MGPGLTEKQIKEVRLLRRKAVRRRRILALSLLGSALLVFFLALGLRFSPLYALIPLFLFALVASLGVRASRRAAAWEKRVAKAGPKRAAKPQSPEKFGGDDAPTYILPAQQEGSGVRFSLGPEDSGVRSLDLRAFDRSSFSPRKESDLEKADLL